MSTKVKWTKSFPVHWDIVPAKRLFPESKTRAAEEDEQLSATQNYGVISQSEFMRLAGRKVVQLNTNQHLRKRVEIGDFVISMRSFQGGLERAWAAGGIRSSYVVLKPHPNLNLGYYQYLFKSTEYIQALQSTANFIRDGQDMSYQDFMLIDLPLPPYSEQKIIAAFLNYEISRIEKLITQQQQLIELLREKRQAVISHAVTKGLHPNVPMKDSGVEWLGDIPNHWLCTKIKHIASLTPKKSSVKFKNDDECTFIPMEKLKRNSLVTDEIKIIRDVMSGYTYFEDGDLLLAKVTPCFENKNIAVARGLVNSVGFGSTEIYVLRPTEKIRVNYLLYRLQEDNFIRAATGAMTGAGGLKRVPSDFLLNYPIAIPPKSEMDAIVAYLNEQEARYDLMEKNATQAVQLLQERRTALISAAVTGKIDVRDWVAPDTQDVEESQEATA